VERRHSRVAERVGLVARKRVNQPAGFTLLREGLASAAGEQPTHGVPRGVAGAPEAASTLRPAPRTR
jgi:hypothetical protein